MSPNVALLIDIHTVYINNAIKIASLLVTDNCIKNTIIKIIHHTFN